MHPPIHSSIQLSIHLSTHPSIHPPIHLSIHPWSHASSQYNWVSDSAERWENKKMYCTSFLPSEIWCGRWRDVKVFVPLISGESTWLMKGFFCLVGWVCFAVLGFKLRDYTLISASWVTRIVGMSYQWRMSWEFSFFPCK
jgi:hypothetical protein